MGEKLGEPRNYLRAASKELVAVTGNYKIPRALPTNANTGNARQRQHGKLGLEERVSPAGAELNRTKRLILRGLCRENFTAYQ